MQKQIFAFFGLFVALVTPLWGHAESVSGTQGMVTSAHPAATEAGIAMLRAGGNAADAAAACAFALAVVEPYSSGIGGGGFATLKMGQALEFLDFREVAPKKARRDMYLENGKPNALAATDGPLAVAVPGAVAGYLLLQERYGSLPRAAVLAPAIVLAKEGFEVDSRYRAITEWRLAALRADAEASRIFLVPGKDGEPPQVPPLHHRIVQDDLARTLEAIAKRGRSAFYEGDVAALLAADMKTRGGLITLEDLKKYQVRHRQPLMGTFRGHAIATAPLPSSGGQILLTILNIMETLPQDTPWRSPLALHTYIEASKRAFADRQLLGDPAFVQDISHRLIAKDRAELLGKVFSERASAAEEVPPGQGAQLPIGIKPKLPAGKERRNTTHLSVIDKDGNAVALTSTVNYGWGAGIVAKGTGVLWNDEMDDFSIAPGVPNVYGIVGSEANAIEPGKIPLSSMTPTLVFQTTDPASPVRMVVGSPGGPRIITTVAQIILNYFEYGAPIDTAVALPRLHQQHLPEDVFVEPFALDPLTRQHLESRGHRFSDSPRTWSNATAIAVDPDSGVRTGSADPRGVGSTMAQ